MLRRELDTIPYDKEFNNEFCTATGYEVCFGNPENPADWWNEYEDAEGDLHYGR
jgi:hypothetical protein